MLSHCFPKAVFANVLRSSPFQHSLETVERSYNFLYVFFLDIAILHTEIKSICPVTNCSMIKWIRIKVLPEREHPLSCNASSLYLLLKGPKMVLWRQSISWIESDRPLLTVASRSVSPKGVFHGPSPLICSGIYYHLSLPSYPPWPPLTLPSDKPIHHPPAYSQALGWENSSSSPRRVRESWFNSNSLSARKEQLIKDEKQAASWFSFFLLPAMEKPDQWATEVTQFTLGSLVTHRKAGLGYSILMWNHTV